MMDTVEQRRLHPASADIWTPNRARARWFDALSVLLPAGERFVIGAARDAEAAWPMDRTMLSAVEQLVRQEWAHRRVHQRYNDGLEARGLPVARMQASLDTLMAPIDNWPLDRRILLAAALEQWTALLSSEVLRSRSWLGRQDNSTVRMWRWHCTEELEHHGTAMALARRARRAPLQWPAIFILAALWIFKDVCRIQSDMLAVDLRRREVTRRALMRDTACFAAQTCLSCLRLMCLAAPHLVRPGGMSLRRGLHAAKG